MEREYFMKTERLGFSRWSAADAGLAKLLWGDPDVTKYICAAGRFTPEEIVGRLHTEMANGARYHVQYWPVFTLDGQELAGCCGLRPHAEGTFEIGFHFRPEFWGRGYASEAAAAVIRYAFGTLGAQALFAGHNPNNTASRRLLRKLGFTYMKDEFYAPTGLYHPSYEMKNPAAANPEGL